MYGKPMISSEIGTGTSYINIHGETGLVVPPSQPAAFRQAMRWLWEHPQQAEKWAGTRRPAIGNCSPPKRWGVAGASCTVNCWRKRLLPDT